jgi:orotidine-5'-phosphate decarboxylase
MTELIVALDQPNEEAALDIVDRFGEQVSWYKVGSQLFTAAGPKIVEKLIKWNKSIFLDLKYHDIPQTVYGSISAAADLGVSIVDIHLSGGKEMIAAAKESAALNPGLEVFGVSVLTSLDDDQLNEVGVEASAQEQVNRLVGLALEGGLAGIVCSVNEVEQVNSVTKAAGKTLSLITPGIRLERHKVDDQIRVATPEKAKELGVDYIVVGRALTQSPDSQKALEQILYEIA